MDVIDAAYELLHRLGSLLKAERNKDGEGLSHAAWMLEGIRLGYVQHEKAHRWLGYAQGIIVANGFMNLETMKSVNKQARKK